jgi:hypothetical protein
VRWALLAVALGSSAVHADGWHIVECPKRQDVWITANGLAIALQGECTTVTISGSANLVTIASTGTLQ